MCIAGGGMTGPFGDIIPFTPREILAIALNNLLGNGDSYTFDESIDSNNSIHFNTIDEFTDFLNTFETDLTIPTIDQGNNRITTFRVDWGLTNLDLFVNQILNNPTENQDYNLVEVTSELSGITLGLSWEQASIEHSVVGNEAIITVFGSRNFNLFIESIGAIYTDTIIIELHIDINTGNPISIFQIEN
ncbi:hypothetical protein [uncultured Dokdonia sp.]|uniref:hypothetical protein n=1 Tax=uncultured Dokdonia sp. TaxID=575653 RepID=UPI00261D17FD|nr:hypothetical protein [uncultured Dokdonia sp.]